VTITRSTSAVPDACNGEEFWAGAIETDKNATPGLDAKATLTELGLARGFILKPEGPTKCDYMFGVKILQAKSPRKKGCGFFKAYRTQPQVAFHKKFKLSALYLAGFPAVPL